MAQRHTFDPCQSTKANFRTFPSNWKKRLFCPLGVTGSKDGVSLELPEVTIWNLRIKPKRRKVGQRDRETHGPGDII